jgi:hypothetical protein
MVFSERQVGYRSTSTAAPSALHRQLALFHPELFTLLYFSKNLKHETLVEFSDATE